MLRAQPLPLLGSQAHGPGVPRCPARTVLGNLEPAWPETVGASAPRKQTQKLQGNR